MTGYFWLVPMCLFYAVSTVLDIISLSLLKIYLMTNIETDQQNFNYG